MQDSLSTERASDCDDGFASLSISSMPSSPPSSSKPKPRTSAEVAALVALADDVIRYAVHRYAPRNCSKDVREDLLAAGKLGAIEAAQRFDGREGVQFQTYAKSRIRLRVTQEAMSIWGKGRVPLTKTTSTIFFRLGRARRRLEAKGVEPTAERLATELGVSLDVLCATLATTAAPSDAHYDEVNRRDTDEDRPQDVCEAVEDPNAINALSVLVGGVMINDARAAFRSLSERERFILEAYYVKKRPYGDIGRSLGLTAQRIQQIARQTVERLTRQVHEAA